MTEDPRRVLAEGKYVRLVARGRWEWAERTNTTGAVVVVAVTEAGELILVDQYRHPLDRRVIELPAGLVGDEPGSRHEEWIEAARRELHEETGYVSDRWEFLIEGPSSPGLTDESYALFLARDARQTGEGGGDGTEDIAVRLVPLDRVEVWLEEQRQQGLLVDPKVYAGLYFAS
jgi:ADP-ribose pyrophosphatase